MATIPGAIGRRCGCARGTRNKRFAQQMRGPPTVWFFWIGRCRCALWPRQRPRPLPVGDFLREIDQNVEIVLSVHFNSGGRAPLAKEKWVGGGDESNSSCWLPQLRFVMALGAPSRLRCGVAIREDGGPDDMARRRRPLRQSVRTAAVTPDGRGRSLWHMTCYFVGRGWPHRIADSARRGDSVRRRGPAPGSPASARARRNAASDAGGAAASPSPPLADGLRLGSVLSGAVSLGAARHARRPARGPGAQTKDALERLPRSAVRARVGDCVGAAGPSGVAPGLAVSCSGGGPDTDRSCDAAHPRWWPWWLLALSPR